MDRRQFLHLTWTGATTISAFSLFGAIPAMGAKKEEFYVTAGGPQEARRLGLTDLAQDSRGYLRLWWPERSEFNFVKLDFRPHGIVQNIARPSELAAFQKWGRKFATVDVLSRKILRETSLPMEARCFGHGLYSPDGKTLLVVCMDDRKTEGYLSIRESSTLKELDRIPTFGQYPHDCHWSDPGKVLIVANTGNRSRPRTIAPRAKLEKGEASGLTWIDLQKKKKVREVIFADTRVRIGQFDTASNGSLVATGLIQTRDGIGAGWACLVARDGRQTNLSPPAGLLSQFNGETLNVSIANRPGVIATINASSDHVLFWDLHSGKFKGSVQLRSPGRGMVTTAQEDFFVVSDARGILNWIKTDNLQWSPHPPSSYQPLGGNGSHLYRFTI